MTLVSILNAIEIAFIVITLLGVLYDYSRTAFSSRTTVPNI
jgi:hypothetical protein